jgi:DNA/RNA endonuclease G (NUC1)
MDRPFKDGASRKASIRPRAVRSAPENGMHEPSAGLRNLVLISLPFAVLVGCASPSPRADREVVPTSGPRSESGEMVATAMDETTDPEPPGGRPDVSAIGDTTVFLQSTGYDVVYSETKHNPLVVAYFLRQHQDNDFECERPPAEAFHTDARTESKVAKTHYVNTGYDRGHMAPNAAIATRYGCDAQLETFLMTTAASGPESDHVKRPREDR